MSAPFNANQGDHFWIDLLEGDGMFDRNKPVARAMQDIRMTGDILHPFIGLEFIPQHEPQRKDRQELLHRAREIIVRRIQDEIARFVLRCQFCCEAATQASAIDDDG